MQRGLTPEETAQVIAALEQEWRRAGDGEEARLAWASRLLVRAVGGVTEAEMDSTVRAPVQTDELRRVSPSS